MNPLVHVVEHGIAGRTVLARMLVSAGYDAASWASPAAFLAAAGQKKAHCAVLDANMPEMDGFEICGRLRDAGVKLPLIFIVPKGDVALTVKAMKSGIIDCLEKPVRQGPLLAAIRAAAPAMGGVDVAEAQQKANERIARLTRREREVLTGLLKGWPTKTIAFHLGVSVRTIEAHRSRMLSHLGTHQIVDALRLGLQANLRND